MSAARTARGQSTSGAAGLGGGADSAAASSSSSANLTAGGKARSESSPPAAYQGRGAQAAKKQSAAAAAARARHRASSSPKTSGDELSDEDEDEDDEGGQAREDSAADDTDPDEKDDEYDEDDLGADMLARAAQDFTSMRLSIARFDAAADPAAAGSSSAARAASSSSAADASGLAAGAPSRDELRVNAYITSAETARDGKGDYILYQLSVTAGGATTGLAWKVGRRFREFEALHKELCTKFGKDHLPGLPKKALRRSLEPEYVRKKKTELAKYVEDLMLDPAVACCEPLAHFLIVNIQDILRSSIENLRIFAQRGSQIKSVEAGLWKAQLDRKKAEKTAIEANKDRDEARDRVIMVEAALENAVNAARARAESDAQHRLDTLQSEWETKYAELTAHAKALHKEKKSALKAVQELDALTRKLKAEKKILVKEVKEQRARMAALGALGATGMITEASGPGGSGSEAGTGTVSPQGATRRSPQFSPSQHAGAGQNLGSLSLSRNDTGEAGAVAAAGGSPMSPLRPLDPSLAEDSLASALASPSNAGLTSPEPVDGVAAMLERNRSELEQEAE